MRNRWACRRRSPYCARTLPSFYNVTARVEEEPIVNRSEVLSKGATRGTANEEVVKTAGRQPRALKPHPVRRVHNGRCRESGGSQRYIVPERGKCGGGVETRTPPRREPWAPSHLPPLYIEEVRCVGVTAVARKRAASAALRSACLQRRQRNACNARHATQQLVSRPHAQQNPASGSEVRSATPRAMSRACGYSRPVVNLLLERCPNHTYSAAACRAATHTPDRHTCMAAAGSRRRSGSRMLRNVRRAHVLQTA